MLSQAKSISEPKKEGASAAPKKVAVRRSDSPVPFQASERIFDDYSDQEEEDLDVDELAA